MWASIFCPSTHLLFLDWKCSAHLCPQRTELPGFLNKSQELHLLLSHVKILYIPTKAPSHPLWPQSCCRNILPAAWHTPAQWLVPVPTTEPSHSPDTDPGSTWVRAHREGDTAPWQTLTAPHGKQCSVRRDGVSRSHGKASCLPCPAPKDPLLAIHFYTHQQSFPSQVWGKRGRSIGDSTNDTLNFSWEITWGDD